jgi:hypothetical protein
MSGKAPRDDDRVGRGAHDAERHTEVTSWGVAGGYEGESE